jgi:hypothetical protein
MMGGATIDPPCSEFFLQWLSLSMCNLNTEVSPHEYNEVGQRFSSCLSEMSSGTG